MADEDRSESPRPGNSKSSVVVLYHEKSVVPAATSPEPPLRVAHSEVAVPREPSPSVIHTARSPRQERLNQDETSEDRSPVYPAERRKATLRRRRRLSKRQRPVNVHIYQDSRVVQVGSLSENHRFASKGGVHLQDQRSDLARYTINTAKNLIRSEDDTSTRQDDDSDDPERDIRTGEQWKRDRGFFGERCRPSDNPVSKLMAHSSPGRDGDCSQCKREAVCPNLAYLMQQIQSRPRERGDDRAFISINDGENSKRVFPFQSTPSGNLKILPNQSF